MGEELDFASFEQQLTEFLAAELGVAGITATVNSLPLSVAALPVPLEPAGETVSLETPRRRLLRRQKGVEVC